MKVPFRNLLLFPNQAPWPGRLGDLLIPLNFRCRTRTRDSQTTPDVPHMLSVHCLYQGSGFHASKSLPRGQVNEFGSALARLDATVSCAAPRLKIGGRLAKLHFAIDTSLPPTFFCFRRIPEQGQSPYIPGEWRLSVVGLCCSSVSTNARLLCIFHTSRAWRAGLGGRLVGRVSL